MRLLEIEVLDIAERCLVPEAYDEDVATRLYELLYEQLPCQCPPLDGDPRPMHYHDRRLIGITPAAAQLDTLNPACPWTRFWRKVNSRPAPAPKPPLDTPFVIKAVDI